MLKNLLLISLRSLQKRKFYSILNIAGLAASMAFSFLLILYVQDQRSYDKHFLNAERIYRVDAILDMNGKRDVYSNAPRPLAPTFKSEFPEVTEAIRIYGLGGLETHTAFLEYNNNRVKSDKIFGADSTVFKVFEQTFVSGDPRKALAEPNSIVLTESLALKVFGTTDVVGKTLNLPEGNWLLKVTGVIKDNKARTHLPVDAFVSFNLTDVTRWYGGHVYTYLLLNESNNPVALYEKFPAFYEKYMKKSFDEFNGKADMIFQPLLSIHLSDEYVWEAYAHGSKANVSALGIVALLLLIFASVNYINLATARASERAAEVGIRKTLGSPWRLLFGQFLSESVVLSLLSAVIAMVLALLMLPYFNQLADLDMTVSALFSLQNVRNIFLLALVIGFVSGIYPAIYLSSLESIKTLKGKFNNRGEVLRKFLVAGQYFMAATLISSILFVAEQTRFIKNKDIGFNKSNLISVTVPGDSVVLVRLPAFMDKLKTTGHISGATSTYYSLDKEANHFTPTLVNEDGSTFQMGADLIQVDRNFVETIGAEFLIGRNFDVTSKADEHYSMLINEAAMRKFGWEKNPLAGRFLAWTPDPGSKEPAVYLNVVGVVKDFNLGASYHTIGPLIMFLEEEGGTNMYVRTEVNATMTAIEELKETWKEFFPGHNLEFAFVDQSLNALYHKEEKFLALLSSFSIMVVFIASLGIVGLISFTTVLRKKEIAIRKVLGSPFRSIVVLLSKKFVGLLLLANMVAIPITYYLVTGWLNNYAYRIKLGAWPFVVSLGISLFFTAFSLLYHTTRSAIENPVEALRCE